MSNYRTIKFLVEKRKLYPGDKIKLLSESISHIVDSIDDVEKKILLDSNREVSFSEKCYVTDSAEDLPPPPLPAPEILEFEQDERHKFTLSFSATVDFEFHDDESNSMEEALEKFRSEMPWRLITKSKVVDLTSDLKLFAMIENEV